MAPTSKSTKTSQLRRNERERKRVHQVNDGFDKLRDVVTKVTANKKLSKADTLREAVKYIQHLRKVLDDGGDPSLSFSQDYLMSSVSSSTYPSPPSYYDESGYYSGHPAQMQLSPQLHGLTPPQGAASSSPQDFYLHHYGIPQYQQVMRTTP